MQYNSNQDPDKDLTCCLKFIWKCKGQESTRYQCKEETVGRSVVADVGTSWRDSPLETEERPWASVALRGPGACHAGRGTAGADGRGEDGCRGHPRGKNDLNTPYVSRISTREEDSTFRRK